MDLDVIDAELDGVPVSALINSGAQGCFISYGAALRLHQCGRNKMEAPLRNRGANGAIKDCFELFPEALLTLNDRTTILEAVVAPISHSMILGQTQLHDTIHLMDYKKGAWPFERDVKSLNIAAVKSLTAKQLSLMVWKEKVHCYALFLDGTSFQAKTTLSGWNQVRELSSHPWDRFRKKWKASCKSCAIVAQIATTPDLDSNLQASSESETTTSNLHYVCSIHSGLRTPCNLAKSQQRTTPTTYPDCEQGSTIYPSRTGNC